MAAEKMRLFSGMMFTIISKMEDKESEKAGLEQGLHVVRDQLENAYADRKTTVDEAILILKRIAQYYKEGKITESKRNEYFQAIKSELVPFNTLIHEYKEAITKFETRIHLLGEMIQEAGEKIQTLMAQNKAEAAKLKPETEKYIFSYTRFNLSLFKALPPSNTAPAAPSNFEETRTKIEQETRSYFTQYNGQSRGG